MLGLIIRIRQTKWAGYLIPLPACLLAWAGHSALVQAGAVNIPLLPFFTALVVIGIFGGLGPGLFAIIIAGLMVQGIFPGLPALLPVISGNLITTIAANCTALVTLVLVDYGTTTAIKLDHASRALRTINETLEARIRERSTALFEAQENLRQAQKMESVGQLTGGIAHDFNNLLTGIMGSLERLETRLPHATPDELSRYLATARDATARAANLTNRLLSFARRQPLNPSVTDINALIAGMEDLIRRTINPGIQLEIAPCPGQCATMVDANQLEHALLNLCINGSDAMPGGGTLRIGSGNTSLTATQAGQLSLGAGSYATLTVSDTGTGMTPEVLSRAFEPFFPTKALGKGTGLGLSMIYGFARQSGGHAHVSSTPGQGTSVSLYLPRHHGALAASTAGAAPAAAPAALLGETILLVDDEPSIRQVAAEVLEELGYTVHQACNAEDALQILRDTPSIGMLIADLGLPGLNGGELAETSRIMRPAMKVLFITGYGDRAMRNTTQPPPSHMLLSKPFSMSALATRVREVLSA